MLHTSDLKIYVGLAEWTVQKAVITVAKSCYILYKDRVDIKPKTCNSKASYEQFTWFCRCS